MAAQPDISQLLAALAATQRPQSTLEQQAPQQRPPQTQLPHQPQNIHQAYQAPSYITPTPPVSMLPQPTSSGSIDLASIKPLMTGSVSIEDALEKARSIATEKGLHPYDGRSGTAAFRNDTRSAGRPHHRSASRSRSPPRRDNIRDSYNPYRDERRDDRRYGRDRSRSPPTRGRELSSPQRGHGGRERSPTDSETITIDSSLVGLVIGRQGENLRRIEQDTSTRVQFITGPDASGPQRQCRITGRAPLRARAKQEIYRIIEENGGQGSRDMGLRVPSSNGRPPKATPPVPREGENNVQIMVPDRTVGLIIGRQGETIRDLQERSGCHVNIVGENKSVNGLRPVNLIGSPAAAARAKEFIMEIVESDTRLSGPVAKDTGRSSAFEPAGHGKLNDTVVVPSEAVGMIIGKGGETIKDMQNSTGCKINVAQASGVDIEREIGLVGSRQSIEDAKRAIWDKVDTVVRRDRNGGMGGRGGRGRDNEPYGERSAQPQQQQAYTQQPAGISQQQTAEGDAAAATAAAAAGGADPYAVYGGYHNYVALWYAALAQGQQGQQGQSGHPPSQ